MVKKIILDTQSALQLKEPGIDLQNGILDLKTIAIGCEALDRYRKAYRVKIRMLLKTEAFGALERYVQNLFALAQFAKLLYGYHSCTSPVNSQQESAALKLQEAFDLKMLEKYRGDNWIVYDDVKIDNDAIQDKKPFLNLKDKAHFEKLMKHVEQYG